MEKPSSKGLLESIEKIIEDYGLSGITLHLWTPDGECPTFRGVERHSIEVDSEDNSLYLITGDGYSDGTAVRVRATSTKTLLNKFWKMRDREGVKQDKEE